MTEAEDKATLRDLAAEIARADKDLRAKREDRLTIAARLRAEGVPMADIAHHAGVSDSYLSRQLINSGAKRRKKTPTRKP